MEIDLMSLPWTKVTNSPDEEWQSRELRWGRAEPLTDAQVAAILTTSKPVTVRCDGIRFAVGNVDYHFFEEESVSIHAAQNGPLLLTARYDADDLACVHLFERAGESIRYVETVARYIAPGVTDKAALAAQLAIKKRAVRRLVGELNELHEPDTRAALAREVSNQEKLQHVRTFPVPSNGRSQKSAVRSQNNLISASRDSDLTGAGERDFDRAIAASAEGETPLNVTPPQFAAHDSGVSSNSASRADAVQGEPASAAPPSARGGAFQLGPNTSEPVAHETKRGKLSERSPQSLVPSPQSKTQDSRLRTRDYILTQRSHPSASATSPDAGAAGDRLNVPTPRQILSEQMDRAGRRARVRVGRAVTQRQQARVDYSDALDDLAVSVTSFNQPNEGE